MLFPSGEKSKSIETILVEYSTRIRGLPHCDFVCGFQFQSELLFAVSVLRIINFIFNFEHKRSEAIAKELVNDFVELASVCAENKINKVESSVYNIEIKTSRERRRRENSYKVAERMMSNAIVRCEVAC